MFSPPSPASKNATPSISLRALLVGGENTLSSSPGMVGRSQTFDRRTGVDVPVLDTSCAFIIRDRFLGGRWWSVASGVSWTVVGEDFFSRAAPVSTAFNFNPAGVFFFRFPPAPSPPFPLRFAPVFPFFGPFCFFCFLCAPSFPFLSTPPPPSTFFRREAYHLFLTSLSLRPGSIRAIFAQRFPSFARCSIISVSSSCVHCFFVKSGFKWLCHRSRHCFPIRPGKNFPM